MDESNDNLNRHESGLQDDLDIKLEQFDSVALRRIIEEVSNDGGGAPNTSTIYNRMYHRHNR